MKPHTLMQFIINKNSHFAFMFMYWPIFFWCTATINQIGRVHLRSTRCIRVVMANKSMVFSEFILKSNFSKYISIFKKTVK